MLYFTWCQQSSTNFLYKYLKRKIPQKSDLNSYSFLTVSHHSALSLLYLCFLHIGQYFTVMGMWSCTAFSMPNSFILTKGISTTRTNHLFPYFSLFLLLSSFPSASPSSSSSSSSFFNRFY